jgi:type II secretion system protein C
MRMVDSPAALRERVRRNGPRLLSIALGTLIAAELVRASLSLFGAHPRSTQLDLREPARLMGAARIDIHKIAAAHLFGVFENPGAQAPRATASNLILAGTIATEDPNHGVAIISGEDAPPRVYWAGQEVSGAMLRSVYLDHVVLDRNGLLEILTLPKSMGRRREPLRASRFAGAATPPAPDNPSSDESPAPEGSVQLALSTVGGARGFRIVGGKALEALRAAGLGITDVVTAINGTPLDQNSAHQSLNEAQGALNVTVTRRGHPTDIKVNLGD